MRQRLIGWLLLCLCALLPTTLVRAADDTGRAIEAQYGLYPDFATNWRVQYIGHRLAQAAGLPNTAFKVFNDQSLNAMALPDGRVYVTSKMATVVTDDELAFVLGHELTHVKEHHAQHQMERTYGGAILGAILVGAMGGSNKDIRLGADIAGNLTLGQYSQKDEYKADTGGVRLMSQCGYDPQKAADAMQRLIDLYGRGDAKTPVLGWFASHPDTQNRKSRLLQTAAELQKKPLPTIAAPLGIEFTLDDSAAHAGAWAHSYFAILLADYGAGRVEVLPSPQYPAPAMVTPPEPKPTKPVTEEETKENVEPLPRVTVTTPPLTVGYRVTLSLHQVPAGRATSIEAGEGTAVEATLRWTQLASGFTGQCVAIAQRKTRTPWQAQEELANPDATFELSNGKLPNIEGTLEANALHRVAMAFAEVVEADSPVDHSAPVTVRIDTGGVRPDDYVYVLRGNLIVAEVRVNAIVDKKTITGTVLWGTHTWKKKDKFVPDTLE